MSLSYSSDDEVEGVSSLSETTITEHLEAFASTLPLGAGEKVLYILPSNLYFIQQAYKKDLRLIGIILFCLWPIFFLGLFSIMIDANIAIYLGIAVGFAFAFCFALYYFIYKWLWTRDIAHYQGTYFIYTNKRLIVKGYNPISRMPNCLYSYNYTTCKDLKLAAHQAFAALSFTNKNYEDLLKTQIYTHDEGFSITVPVDMHAKSIIKLIENN